MNGLKRFYTCAALVGGLCVTAGQSAWGQTVTGITSLQGNATVIDGVGPGGDNITQLTSTGQLGDGNTYGNIIWTPSVDFTLNQLTSISADFEGSIGTMGGGGPRFAIWLDWNGTGVIPPNDNSLADHLFVIWGTDAAGFQDVPSYTTYTSTGNFVGNTNANWDISQVGQSGLYPYLGYSAALNAAPNAALAAEYDPSATTVDQLIGNLRVLQIGVIDDAGWSQPATGYVQQFNIDSVTITGDTSIDSDGISPASSGLFTEKFVASYLPTIPDPVPEPATASLILLGGGVLLLRRRRRSA